MTYDIRGQIPTVINYPFDVISGYTRIFARDPPSKMEVGRVSCYTGDATFYGLTKVFSKIDEEKFAGER